ncbi:MAG: hypothetical protein DU429_03995 [Candidatus Tokpelaia sp.]|nr:MAG: hypothetical protein DU430_06380 [Candidatus Tokpelaia sp.]KAA6207020.1 MAG: hypothetical protein DU429_03995 [Candidatus Tokpelaia sp.]
MAGARINTGGGLFRRFQNAFEGPLLMLQKLNFGSGKFPKPLVKDSETFWPATTEAKISAGANIRKSQSPDCGYISSAISADSPLAAFCTTYARLFFAAPAARQPGRCLHGLRALLRFLTGLYYLAAAPAPICP